MAQFETVMAKPTDILPRRIMVSVALLAMLLLVLYIAPAFSDPVTAISFGASDFVQYYAAWHALQSGANPYDPAVMQSFQQAIDARIGPPMMMWTAPWALLFMAPVVTLPFAAAVRAWVVVSFLLFILSGIVGGQSCSLRSRLLAALSPFLFLVPIGLCLRLGQIGPLLAFGFAFLLLGVARNRFLLIGCGLALLSIKPHLFILPVLSLVVWILRLRSARPLLHATLPMLVVLILTEFLLPGALSMWMKARWSDLPGVPGPWDWVPATVVGVLRSLKMPLVVSVLVPGLAACGWLLLLLRRGVPPNTPAHYLTAGAASLLVAPFGWPFDHVVLISGVPLLITTASIRDSEQLTSLTIGLLSISLAALAIIGAGGVRYVELFWIPLAFLLLWRWCKRAAAPLAPSDLQERPVHKVQA